MKRSTQALLHLPARALLPALVLFLAQVACDDTTAVNGDGQVQADTSSGSDAGVDSAAPDSGGPLANVYKISPLEDKQQTSVVPLKEITDPQGLMTGKRANVYNCMPDPGGQKIEYQYGGMKLSGILCTPRKTAKPGQDGSYLHITPPAQDTAANDAFTEVMMYHHVTTYHGHLTKDLGLTHIKDKPLKCIVNLQGKINLLGDRWTGMPNAAFMPKESGDLLKQLGIDLLGGEDAIVFGFNNIPGYGTPANFSWDASVIYHEYTHYSIGGALWMPAKDKYGVDPTPKGLNEALADYFPASFLEISTLGKYALGSSARDLKRDLRCPGHIVGEEHRDGEIASGALWAARQILTAQVADKAYWNAIISFSARTNFDEAAQAFLAEIKKVAPTKHAAVQKIFADRGFWGCVRLQDHKDITKPTSYGPGYTNKAYAPTEFVNGVPGFMQYKVALKDTTKEVTIEYHPGSAGTMGIGARRDNVALALQKGSAPITWSYTTGKAVSSAKTVLQGVPLGTTGYKLVLSGDCITKDGLVYQYINNGVNAAAVHKVIVTQSDTKTNTTDNFTGC